MHRFLQVWYAIAHFAVLYRNQYKGTISDEIMYCNRNRNIVMIILPVQCRMARAALGLGVRELAAAAKVSIDTVARFERGDELKERTIDALQRALEAAGVEFTNGGQPGVRLTRAAAARSAEAARASRPPPSAKAVRGQTANASKKKR
jgi:transcriptional regulator with XRE-family HTH domain